MAAHPCRLCLVPKAEGIDIFHHSYPEDERLSIVSSIKKIFSFSITPSERLRYICAICLGSLKELSKFFNLVVTSQIFLSTHAKDYKGTYTKTVKIHRYIVKKKYLTNVVANKTASQNLSSAATPSSTKVKEEFLSQLKSSVLDEDVQYDTDKNFEIKSEFYKDVNIDFDQSCSESIGLENSNALEKKCDRESYTIISEAPDSNSIELNYLTNKGGELKHKIKQKVARSEKLYYLTDKVEHKSASQNLSITARTSNTEVTEKLSSKPKSNILNLCMDSDPISIESIEHKNSNVHSKKSKRNSNTSISKTRETYSSKTEGLKKEIGELNDKSDLRDEADKTKEKVKPKKLFENGNLTVRGPLLEDAIRKFYKTHCVLCSDEPVFERLSDMFQHYDSVHKTKGFIACCDTRYYTRRSIISHMARHLQKDAFKCPICKKELLCKISMKAHLLNHLPPAERPYKCDVCEHGFSCASSLRTHKQSHLPVEKRRSYKCKYCDKSFPSTSAQQYHMSMHSGGNYLCSECGRGFPSKTSLTKHLQVHDKSGANNVQCKQCGVILKNQQSLKMHLKIHNVRIPCKLCDYTAHRIAQLNLHMKEKHTDIKPYECKFCNSKFKRKKGLDMHMAQHTGERKYSCSYCPKTFASGGNCYSHQKKMHFKLFTRDAKIKKEQRLEKFNLIQRNAAEVSDVEEKSDRVGIQEFVQEEIKRLYSKTEWVYTQVDDVANSIE